MILGLDHIAIICSSEQSVDFYKNLGFEEVSREDRGYDVLLFLKGYGLVLEMFIDPTHPPRVDRPEAMGLRHLALRVDDVGGHAEGIKNRSRDDTSKRRQAFHLLQRPRRTADRAA